MKKLLAVFCLLFLPIMTFAQELTEAEHADPLTERHPTLEQLENYLMQFPLSDGEVDGVFRWYDDPLHYVDLNGDGELDLVAEGHLHFAVMVWIDGQYSEPLQAYSPGSPRNPYSKIEFEDWTSDGIPEVVFHHRIAYSGTDIGGFRFYESVIHCTEIECHVIWDEKVADIFNSYAMDGRSIQQTGVELSTDDSRNPRLRTVTTEFVYGCAYSCGLEHDVPLKDGEYPYSDWHRVGAVIERTYIWVDSRFELATEQWLSDPYVVEFPTRYESSNEAGDIAILETSPTHVDYYWREFSQCQLTINHTQYGSPFICDAADVRWQDITGDEHQELVITAFAGASGVQDGEKDCAHQRFIAYQQVDDGFQQMANVIGCLVQIDLFGIRLEDVDDDPALELILAGDFYTAYDVDTCRFGFCWYEPNDTDEVYDWDDAEYKFSHTVRRDFPTLTDD